jgi:hypothetical protein
MPFVAKQLEEIEDIARIIMGIVKLAAEEDSQYSW